MLDNIIPVVVGVVVYVEEMDGCNKGMEYSKSANIIGVKVCEEIAISIKKLSFERRLISGFVDPKIAFKKNVELLDGIVDGGFSGMVITFEFFVPAFE